MDVSWRARQVHWPALGARPMHWSALGASSGRTRENEQESKGEKEDSNSSGDEEERASSCSAPTSESSGREGGLHWLLPKGVKTRIHRASGLLDDAASAIPRCRVTSGGAFTWGYEEGHSMGSALDAGRKFCRRCFPEV